MTDLTEKILSLDLQSASALQDAKVLSVEAKKNADKYKDHEMKEVQKLFGEEKKSDAKALAESFEEEKKHARSKLNKKIRAFDEHVNIDSVVEYLINVAKEKICR